MTTHVLPPAESGPASAAALDAPHGKPRAKAASGPVSPLAGTLWVAGWLFTIGFAKLVWWKVLLGLLIWPYFLGTVLR